MTGDKVDRYVRGELTPAEARELAQASLDSPDLFDELTDTALAKAALDPRILPSEKVVRFPRKVWFAVAGVAAAAVLLLLWLVPPKTTLKPVLVLTGQGQRVLLASGLQPDQAPVFRGAESGSRAPRTMGSIVGIEDGVATIDLGSVDGLQKGSDLTVSHDGRLQVTTLFRERARGRIVDGKPAVKDQVRVSDGEHLAALLEQINALYNRGDADAAFTAAEQAAEWLKNAAIPPARQGGLWNELGVLRILRGDSHDGEAALDRALAVSPKTDPVYAQSLNNLGVMAELRGDRRAAKSRYQDALTAVVQIPGSPEQEHRAVAANLSRLQGRH